MDILFLILATLEVYLKSKKNASVLAGLGNLGKETEMCVLRERAVLLMSVKGEK